MKIKIKKISKKIKIPINSDIQRIEQIKNEFSNCANCAQNPELCEVEVFDMWDELRSNS